MHWSGIVAVSKIQLSLLCREGVKAQCAKTQSPLHKSQTTTVATNIIYVICNFEIAGYLKLFMPRKLSTVFKNNLILCNYFSKLTKLSIERSMLQTWNAQSTRKLHLSLKMSFAVHYIIYYLRLACDLSKCIATKGLRLSKVIYLFWKSRLFKVFFIMSICQQELVTTMYRLLTVRSLLGEQLNVVDRREADMDVYDADWAYSCMYTSSLTWLQSSVQTGYCIDSSSVINPLSTTVSNEQRRVHLCRWHAYKNRAAYKLTCTSNVMSNK